MQYSLPRSIRLLEDSLKPILHEVDVIVVSGLSGVIPGGIIAHIYDKQLVVVRKDEDVTHGLRMEGYEYFQPGTPYVVLDDFISSGKTMRRIFECLEERYYQMPKYVVLYRGMWKNFTVHPNTYLERSIAAHHVTRGLYAPYVEKGKKWPEADVTGHSQVVSSST